jgi:hypothetical protein
MPLLVSSFVVDVVVGVVEDLSLDLTAFVQKMRPGWER